MNGVLMNERVFNKELERLRDPSRLEVLEIDRVVNLSIATMQPESLSVLDVGTGTGIFAEAFAKRGCQISGIDIKEEMIAAATRFVPSGNFRIGAAENIPFDKNAFDIVFFGLVLHETDNLLKTLTEAKRVAKKGVIALEWPYVSGEKGPPLNHRLKSEDIRSCSLQAGFMKFEMIELKHLVIYKME